MKQQQHKQRNETAFPAITRHAAVLDVTRSHLWMVLKGQRKDASGLIARYKQLLRNENRPVPANLGKAA